MSDPVVKHLLEGKAGFLEKLAELISCQSVSTDSGFAEGMEKARVFLEKSLVKAGFANVRRLHGGGNPAIYADYAGKPGKPTLIVYGHYDVQPPDPLRLWKSEPFAMDIRENRIYGRGASDDKGPTLIALETLAAFLEIEKELPFNVKILLEGEEETGSPSMKTILSENKDLLAADAVLSADGARWRADLITLNTGTRGNGGLEFRVRTACKDLHSGRYGGIAPNALHVISGIVNGFRDNNGRITIPGFYDGVRELNAEEKKELAEIPMDEAKLFHDLESYPFGEDGYGFLERLWHRPTLEVNGLWGGYTGKGSKTVIPNEAFAKITSRLVPGQDPVRIQKQIIRHLQSVCPAGAKLDITSERNWFRATSVPQNHPLLNAAENSLIKTTGVRPRLVRIGASLPLIGLVEEQLGINTVMFSYSTADEDYHAPNEFLRMSSLDEGFKGWTEIIRQIGKQSAENYSRFKNNVD